MRQRGGTVREVIPPGEQLPSPQTRSIPFTLITDVTPDMAVMQEDYVNAFPIPLGAYWFGPDSADFR